MIFLIAATLLCYSIEARELPKSSYKYQNAYTVFKQLKRAIGHSQKGEPVFKMIDTQYCVARMNFHEGVIELEERAYDVCSGFGADSLNALAVLLGHELTHYYLDHDWHNSMGSSFASEEMGHEMHQNGIEVKSMEHMESEADEFGGIYGYLAGFNTLGIGPELLDNIYASYGLEEEMEGYPSLNQRKRIAHDAQLKLQDLIPVFDAANYLTAMGLHEQAARCYKQILKEFPGRSIMNNAAVALASESLSYFDRAEVAYDFPFELDATTRLSTGLKGTAANVSVRNRLLKEAAELLSSAIATDPGYVTAQLNLAMVYELMEESKLAGELLGSASKQLAARPNADQEALLLIARAIIADRGGDRAQAKQLLEQSLAIKPLACGRNNERVLKDIAIRPTERSMGFAQVSESIKGQKIADIYRLFQDSQDHKTQYLGDEVKLHSKEVQCSNVVWLEADDHLIMLQTGAHYDGSSAREIAIGSKTRAVQRAYGMPSSQLNARTGAYLVYEKEKIAFFVARNEVQSWMIWDRY